MDEDAEERVVELPVAEVKVTALAGTIWRSDNYAEDWYRDTVAEACVEDDHNARRREVISASCFAETFIFEWARRLVNIQDIDDYFPAKSRFAKDPRYRRKLVKKWREVPRELYSDGKIPVSPNLNLSDLTELLRYRHGLVHAAASRPATDHQPDDTRPFPTKQDLKSLDPGWALGIVYRLAGDLLTQTGEPTPGYLQLP